MTIKTQFTKYRAIRLFAFVLFLAALIGPWVFDRVYVPAKYVCEYRLEGDFCGVPLSGFQVLAWLGLGAVGMVFNAGGQIRIVEYFIVLFFLFPVFPFLSNILMLLKENSQRLQITNLICWGLASLLVLRFFIFGVEPQADQLWGFWLYIGLAVMMLCMEGSFLRQTNPNH